jgi:hypothetical protein
MAYIHVNIYYPMLGYTTEQAKEAEAAPLSGSVAATTSTSARSLRGSKR